MTIVDVNLLLYATIATFPQHEAAKSWLEKLLLEEDTIGLPWVSIWGYLRLATSNQAFAVNVTPTDAFAFIRSILASPGVQQVNPGPRHLDILQELAIDQQSRGGKLTDAVLAALAIENGATLASTDKDFSRFPKLKWLNPIA